MASTQLGDDKLPVEVDDEAKDQPRPAGALGGPEEYSVERVEKVYR